VIAASEPQSIGYIFIKHDDFELIYYEQTFIYSILLGDTTLKINIINENKKDVLDLLLLADENDSNDN